MASSSSVELSKSAVAASIDESGLWPLPLTPFEHFMLLDDRPEYPMTFFGELRFAGELRQREFEHALQAAAVRHPLLRARVDRTSADDVCWIPLDGGRPSIDRGTSTAPIVSDHNGFLDLTRQPGVRVWVRVGEGTSYMLWQFHHACCDGHGAMRFIEDVLTVYAAATTDSGPAPQLRPVELSRLKSRYDFAVHQRLAAEHPRPRLQPLREALTFHLFGPRPLEPGRSVTNSPTAGRFPGTHTHYFNDAESAAIRAAASGQAGTLNDAAVVAVLRTLRDWNRDHGRRRGRLRVLMPIDLRVRGDELLPATNRMTFGFITRPVAAIDDPRRLLDGVRDETQYVRRTGAGLDFLHALSLLHRSSLFSWLLRRPRCLATAVLTNMGDPTRRFAHRFPRTEGRCVVGNVVLESITGSPPLRPLTRVGFGIGTYAGRIVINAKCDASLFSDADTGRILEMFAQRLLKQH